MPRRDSLSSTTRMSDTERRDRGRRPAPQASVPSPAPRLGPPGALVVGSGIHAVLPPRGPSLAPRRPLAGGRAGAAPDLRQHVHGPRPRLPGFLQVFLGIDLGRRLGGLLLLLLLPL